MVFKINIIDNCLHSLIMLTEGGGGSGGDGGGGSGGGGGGGVWRHNQFMCDHLLSLMVRESVRESIPGSLGYLPRCSAHRATPARPRWRIGEWPLAKG